MCAAQLTACLLIVSSDWNQCTCNSARDVSAHICYNRHCRGLLVQFSATKMIPLKLTEHQTKPDCQCIIQKKHIEQRPEMSGYRMPQKFNLKSNVKRSTSSCMPGCSTSVLTEKGWSDTSQRMLLVCWADKRRLCATKLTVYIKVSWQSAARAKRLQLSDALQTWKQIVFSWWL